MAKMIDKKPTYNGEAKVWERLNEYLPNDIVVYNQREINGREYDFCLMIENVGMLIIEVKGWKADKICVNGVDEIEVEGYDKTQTSPKKQARAYRFALLNKISEKYNVSPLVLDMVCYPFISKEEYLEKHLNIISEEAYTIFSEDLDDGDLLNKKINTVFEKNNLIPHSDFTYDLMLRIRRNYEPDLMKKNEYADAITPYSKLFFLPSSVDASKCKEVVDMYAAGVKTVVFVERRESFKSILSYLDYFLKKMNIGYKKNNLFVGSSEKMEKHYEDDIFRIFNFELYMYSALSRICETSFEIVEGKVTDDNKIILRKLSENTEFNLQQYEVEHATTEKNILVEAGAGTGKTFSMVSRVAFLCNKELDPVMNIADEIAMVTFTNDAAINMKKRLKQMFINYFVLTGSEKYLKYVEDIDRSQISTIHKFAIGILRGESLYTGLGTNFRISSNEYKRGKAYDIFLGEFLEEMEEKNSNFVNELPVPIYDLKKKLMSIADKLFAKSINLEQIKPAEMGVTVDNNIPYFNELLTRVVFPAEATYIESMKNSNDVDLNAYRFQTQDECRIMLCDYTGGEGRNFQCADYIIHIDLPWDASMIEQRIGRLDRLERDMSRPVVYSVVVHAKDTFEEALFTFFKDGLKIFNQSLSGMEIIMKDINDEIISAIKDDFKYGLFDKIPHIVDLANTMKEVIRKEQNFDAAGFIYRPMYAELRRLIEYYSQNENELFASTMSNWASLAGFHGSVKKNGEIMYSANSFSPKSAINSQLIPPKWNDYLNTEQNKVLTRVQAAYEKSTAKRSQERAIRGTFSRKLAIENDYLHFFAPGDEIFECIVDNAINSCKGCASAFATLCRFDWTGLIFTWSIAPDSAYMLDAGVSLYAMSPYRNYLLSDQVIVPITINNPDELDDESIIREYTSIINKGFAPKMKIVHLGKRSREAKFLKDEFEGRNIDWFIENYGGEDWDELLTSSRKEAYTKAVEVFKRRSNIRGAREEMERSLSARMANKEYYGMDDEGIDKLQENQKVVLDAMKRPKIHLESVAFIMMIGAEDE